MIRGLLLDFYGTVVEDDDAVMELIAAHVAAHAARPVTAAEVAAAWNDEYVAVAEGTPFRPLRESATLSLGTIMAAVDCPGDSASLYAHFASRRPPPLRPGTREFLARVAVPVCIVSDADRSDLYTAIAHHGLAFAAVVCSEEVGAYKPAPAMFARALAALALGPHEVLHIGDSLRCDVAGARAAGIRTVWINRHERPAVEEATADLVVGDLGELLECAAAGIPRHPARPGAAYRP